MSKKVVLIGDLIQSRKKQDRQELQKKLEAELNNVNREFESQIQAPLKLIRGDEFEGVFKTLKASILAFEKIESGLYPDKIRAGIGIGEITTEITNNVSNMDGPAFYRARDMIEKGGKSSSRSSILLVKCGNQRIENTVNIVLRLMGALKSDWTKREREIVNHWIFEDYPTQEKIAKEFGIKRSTVASHLSNAHHRIIKESRKFIFNLINEFEGERDYY